MIDISKSPYYDRYQLEEKDKGYTHLLAVPGRVAQAREFTQMQSLLKDIIKGIGDSIMKDGNIVDGCQVTIRDISMTVVDPKTGEEKTYPKTATVSKGKVYINGIVIPLLEDTDIGIDGEGEEIIGFQLVENRITENEDTKLKDPAVGDDNSLQPGCHRIKSTLQIVKLTAGGVAITPEGVKVSSEGVAVLVTLKDGAVAVENYAGNYSELEQTLARRTHDESGSYIVEGLKVRVEDHPTDDTQLNVVIESGKAYVLGYELKIPAPRRIPVSRALEPETVTISGLTYSKDKASYSIYEYPYVKEESTIIVGVIDYPDEIQFEYNNPQTGNQLIDLNEKTRVSIIRITGEDGIDYTEKFTLGTWGGYYTLEWLESNTPPEITFNIKYEADTEFTYGTDYILEQDTSYESQGATIRWIREGKTPKDGGKFDVTYTRYLAKRGVVYIDQYGDVAISEGESAIYTRELSPEAPVDTLALATIMFFPNGKASETLTTNIGLTRFTMNDIQRILNRLRTVEYDQSVISLNTEAKQYDLSAKKGIFTDPLVDLSRVDYLYNKQYSQKDGYTVVNTGYPSYDVTIDFLHQMCYLPIVSHTIDLTVNESDGSDTVRRLGRSATLPVEGEPSVVLAQLKATDYFLVNPYSAFPQIPEISISPATDTWIEDTIIEVPRSQTSNEIVRSSTRHIEVNNTQGTMRASTSTSSDNLTAIGNRVSTSSTESVINEMAVKYIRSREIEVVGSHFKKDLSGIRCLFDGIDVTNSLVSLDPETVVDTEKGITADGNGTFRVKFTIPEQKILTGIREIKFYSDAEKDYGYQHSALALYQAAGTARTIQRTVTTLTTILLERETTVTTTNYIDPVGQTFVLDRMTIVQGIDLYFKARAEDGGAPITCEIREVLNGMITSTVYGHKTLEANTVQVSEDASVATRFNFDDPVLLQPLKEYAFVVRSTSPSYQIWIAELGKPEILPGDTAEGATGGTVLSNPYLVGVMMSSSNNSSWSVHQNKDIKFRLLENNYQRKADIIFKDVDSAGEFSRLYLLAESVIPDGTKIQWYYSTNGGESYKAISPYRIETLNSMIDRVQVKATLSINENNSSTHLSPILILDSVGIVTSYYDATEKKIEDEKEITSPVPRYYVSNFISNLDKYTEVKVILDTYESSDDQVQLFINFNSVPTTGANFDGIQLTRDTTGDKELQYGWKEKLYTLSDTAKDKMPKDPTSCRIFIRLQSKNNYSTPAFRRLRVIFS